jgi:hypothetical protein
VAGAYTATYAAADVGFTQDGYKLSRENKVEVINKTDLYGDTIIDMVYRGGDTFIQFLSRVYKQGSITPWWPWGVDIGTIWDTNAPAPPVADIPQGGPIAMLASSIASAFIMTAVANTPAAAAPATLSAVAILAPGYNTELLFDSRCRNVPIRLLLLPQSIEPDYLVSIQADNTGNNVDDRTWFSPLNNTSPTVWNNTSAYIPGDYVSDSGTDYVCLFANTDVAPPQAGFWLAITLNPTGTYNPATTYAVGDEIATPGNEQGLVFTTT